MNPGGYPLQRYRHILALLLSTLLSLQALMAVALPCSMSIDSGSGVIEAMDDDSHHAHHNPAATGDTAADDANSCCDAGYCSQGGCLSIAAAANDVLPAVAESTRAPSIGYTASSPLHSTSNLLRPPSA